MTHPTPALSIDTLEADILTVAKLLDSHAMTAGKSAFSRIVAALSAASQGAQQAEPVATVIDIDRKNGECIIDAALELGTAVYLAAPAATAATAAPSSLTFDVWMDREYPIDCNGRRQGYRDKSVTELMRAAWDAAPTTQHVSAPALDADEMTRLRRLMRALGMDGSVNASDEYVRGILFTVLGNAAGRIDRAAPEATQPAAAEVGGLTAIKAPDGYKWELIADQEWCGGTSNAGSLDECESAIAAMAALHKRPAPHQEAEGSGQDAKRYRFLRSQWVSFSAAPPLSNLHYRGNKLDAKIDAAMSASPATKTDSAAKADGAEGGAK